MRTGKHIVVDDRIDPCIESCGCDILGECGDLCGIAATDDTVEKDIAAECSVSGCAHGLEEEEEMRSEEAIRDSPTVPIITALMRGKHVKILVDTGAFTSIVSTRQYKDLYPDTWKRRLNERGVGSTRFSLADGKSSTAPRGRAEVEFDMGGDKPVKQWVWVMDDLAHPVILGSNCLDSMGTTISYPDRTVSFAKRPDITPVLFDMSDKNRFWRRPAPVRLRKPVTLRPGETKTVPARVLENDMECLHARERVMGDLLGVDRTVGELGLKAQFCDMDEDGRMIITLINHSLKVQTVTAQEVVAGFMPVGRQNYHILGGREDKRAAWEARVADRKNSQAQENAVFHAPSESLWDADSYEKAATGIMEKHGDLGGVVLVDIKPSMRVNDVWVHLEDAARKRGFELPVLPAELSFYGERVKHRQTFSNFGIKHRCVVAVLCDLREVQTADAVDKVIQIVLVSTPAPDIAVGKESEEKVEETPVGKGVSYYSEGQTSVEGDSACIPTGLVINHSRLHASTVEKVTDNSRQGNVVGPATRNVHVHTEVVLEPDRLYASTVEKGFVPVSNGQRLRKKVPLEMTTCTRSDCQERQASEGSPSGGGCGKRGSPSEGGCGKRGNSVIRRHAERAMLRERGGRTSRVWTW